MVGFYRKVCLGKQKGWKPIKPVRCLSSSTVDDEINQVKESWKTKNMPDVFTTEPGYILFTPLWICRICQIQVVESFLEIESTFKYRTSGDS